MPLERDLGLGDSGPAVRELHDALLFLIDLPPITRAFTARLRRLFDREHLASTYGPATVALIAAFQGSRRLGVSGASDEPTRADLLTILRERAWPPLHGAEPPEPTPDASKGSVSGTVFDRFTGRSGLSIILELVRAGGNEEILAVTESARNGDYRLDYDRAAAARECGGVNIRVSAVEAGRRVTPGPTILNAPAEISGVDLRVEADADGTESDFSRVMRDAVAAAAEAGLDLADIEESDEQPDISLIASQTGHPTAKIALAVAAARTEKLSEGGVTAELAYALASEGVPFGAVALAGSAADAVKEKVAAAVDRKTVSASAVAAVDRALRAARDRLASAELESMKTGTVGKRLLRAAGDDKAAGRFVDAAAAHVGDAESFWRNVEADLALSGHAPRLRLALEATALAGADEKIVDLIQKLAEDGEIAGFDDLVGLTAADWDRKLGGAGIDAPGIDTKAPAANRAAARTAYARGLEMAIEAARPNLFAQHRLDASRLRRGTEVADFLRNAPGFSLGASRLTALRGADAAKAAALPADTRQTIEALGRTVRLTRRIGPAIALIEDGLDSAHAIAGMGPLVFARRHGASFGGTGQALIAHGAAVQTTHAAAELLIQMAPAPSQSALSVLPPSGVTALPGIPDWPTVFGAEDACACLDCRSMTSASAYLVDLLEFLKKRAPKGSATPLDVLLAADRRPDIAQAELSCENSHTIIRYIDLVVEVLADAVAPPPPFAAKPIAGPVAADKDGRITAILRQQVDAALGYSPPASHPAGAPWPPSAFAFSPDATLTSMGADQPVATVQGSWRIEDVFATYILSADKAGAIQLSARLRSTRGPSDERLLHPQYENREAFRRLADAYYPWTLPFDRPLAETRAGLTALETSLASVLEVFAPGTAAERRTGEQVVHERLGLSPVDAALVVADAAAPFPLDPTEPWRHWGFPGNLVDAAHPIADPANATADISSGENWAALLARRVDVLLQQGQFDYATLLALIDTLWVNPAKGDGRTLHIVSTDPNEPATCRPAKLSIDGLDAGTAMRMARMARLSQRSGLEFREIDTALNALEAADMDRSFLRDLSLLSALRDRLGIDWDELCAWFVTPNAAALAAFYQPPRALRLVDTQEEGSRFAPSLYQRLFTRSAAAPTSGFPAEPADLATDPADVAAALARAFGVGPADIVKLAAAPEAAGGGPAGFAKIALVHRHAGTMRALGLTAEEHLAALRLFGPDIFATPAALAEHVAAVERTLASGVGIGELAWLARGETALVEPRPPEADMELLEILRSALRQAEADNRFVPPGDPLAAPTRDPNGDLLRTKLNQLGWPERLVAAAGDALADGTSRSVQDDTLPAVDPAKIERSGYAAPLAAMPAGLNPGPITGGKVSYDSAGQRLVADGLLDDSERQALTSADPDADYQAAAGTLLLRQDVARGRARWDPDAKRLSFSGPMSLAWRAHLDGLSGDAAWRAAVAELFEAPRRAMMRLLRSFALGPAAAPLAPPPPVRLPPGLDGRLYHDRSVAPAQLRQSGPLLPEEIAVLKSAADGADAASAAFRGALDALDAAHAAAVVPPADLFLDQAAIDAILDPDGTAEERRLAILDRLLPRVAEQAAAAAVAQSIGAGLQLPPATAAALCAIIHEPAGPRSAASVLRAADFVASAPALVPNDTAFPAQHDVLRLLRRAAFLTAKARLTAADFPVIARLANWPDLSLLPLKPLGPAAAPPVAPDQLLRFVDYGWVRDRLRRRSASIADIVDAAGAAGATLDDVAAAVAPELQRGAGEIAAVAGPALTALGWPGTANDERTLLRLIAALDELDRLGLAPDLAIDLRAPSLSFATGRTMIGAAGRNQPADLRAEMSGALVDRIRTASRDALVAYLLARGRPAENGMPARRWRRPSDLSRHFLCDVEMGDCMETSRLLQAILSTQMFIQLCRQGQVPEVDADPEQDDGWLQLQWLSRQTLRAANLETQLYPENLLFHDIRDDRSQAFRTFEGKVGQGELTPETATRALLDYLTELKRLSNLKPVSIADDWTGSGQVQHLLAMVPGDPPEYQYRRRDWTKIWTAWEKVELEISSEHVFLHVWRGRTFLFWMSMQRDKGEASLKGDSVEAATTVVWNLLWSELIEGKWTPQRRSRETLSCVAGWDALADPRNFVFRIGEWGDALHFGYRYISDMFEPSEGHPGFRVEYPHAEPQIEPPHSFKLPWPLPGANWSQSGQIAPKSRNWVTSLALELPSGSGEVRTALAKVPGGMAITMAGTLSAYSLTRMANDVCDQPFMLRDAQRSFLVTPVDERPFLFVDPKVYWDAGSADQKLFQLKSASRVRLAVDPAAPEVILPSRPIRSEALRSPAAVAGEQAQVAGVAASLRSAEAGLSARVRTDPAAIDSFNKAKPATGLLNLIGMPGLATTPQSLSLSALKAEAHVGVGASADSAGLAESPRRNWAEEAIRQHDFSIWFKSDYTYRFEPAYVPHVDALIDTLLREGVEAMLSRDVQLRPYRYGATPAAAPLGYASAYGSMPNMVSWTEAKESLDFDHDSFCSVYLWELFYHIPSLLADRYLAGHRYEEALRINQTIVNFSDQSVTVALDDGTAAVADVARYWQTKPLFLNSLPNPGADGSVVERERIEHIVKLLARAAAPDAKPALSIQETRDLDRFRLQIEEMRRHPYQPFRIARLRTSAFQRAAAMREIEIRIAWGDQLFRRDTMESINAATLHYLAAADFRGRAAETVPPRALAAPQTYAMLKDKIGEGSNALIAIEAFVTPSAAPAGSSVPGAPVPSMLAFCIPPNRKLERLWSTVSERLYRIRNCMTIDGVRRRLALFEPRIDPALLARAAAAGIDMNDALADISGPTPPRRFKVLLDHAAGLARECAELGGKLLAAMEKRDAEALALLRANHEVSVLERANAMMKMQEDEAKAQVAALRQSREAPLLRLAHYQRLLGEPAAAVREGAKIAIRPPRRDTATGAPQLFKLSLQLSPILGAMAQLAGQGSEELPVTTYEDFELALQAQAQADQMTASAFDIMSSFAHSMPNLNLEPFGVGTTFGGSNIGSMLGGLANVSRAFAAAKNYAASLAGRFGQLATRADDWILQRNSAALEVMSIDRQLIVSQIGLEMARQRLADGKLQVEESKAVEEAMRDKPTNVAAYNWMIGRFSQAHSTMHRLAFDAAKRAQRRARFELARPDIDVIRPGQWNGQRDGLTAGEALAVDLRTLEAAYEEARQIEQPMIQHVSLAQIDPGALVRLRATGPATVTINEALLDLAQPGYYLRRLVDMAVTIPCVTGPYTGVHLKLTLLRSTTRMTSALAGKKGVYARARDRDDPRFADVFTPTQSIVTSTGRDDDGQAQMPRDEGLDPPFAGMGAISTWRLELPAGFRTVDWDTMTDVILRLRYTGRAGDERFRNQCEAELKTALSAVDEASNEVGLMRLFTLRHEEPSAWRSFLEQPGPAAGAIQLPIRRERLPFFVAERPVDIRKVRLFAHVDPARAAEVKSLTVALKPTAAGTPETLTFASWLPGILVADWNGKAKLPESDAKPDDSWTLTMASTTPAGPVDPTLIDNLEVLVSYGFA